MLHTMLAALNLGGSSQAMNAHLHTQHMRHHHILIWLLGFVGVFSGQLNARAQSSTASINTPGLDAATAATAATAAIATTAATWTLHVATHTSAQRARAHADRLIEQGFDAYVQAYGPQPDGSQLAGWQRWQVRVGCFLNETAAGYTSTPLQTLTGRSSTLVPLSVGADVRVCVDHQLGFLVPDQWQLFAETAWAVAFEVSLAGQTGYVVYSDAGWQIMQNTPPDDVLQPWTLSEGDTSTNPLGVTPQPQQVQHFASISVMANSPSGLLGQTLELAAELAADSFATSANEAVDEAADEAVDEIVDEIVDVVTYQSGQSSQDNHIADGVNTIEGVPAEDVSIVPMLHLGEQDMTPAERALARSLARLPAQPSVSVQSAGLTTQHEDVARAQAHQDSTHQDSTHQGSNPAPARAYNNNVDNSRLTQHIIVAPGDLIWQSPSAAVVQVGQQIVSLVMFPPPQHELVEASAQQHQLENAND